MKVQIEELKTIMKVLKSGLSSGKETTDQSSSFVFQDGMAYSYNDEVSVRIPFPLEEVAGAVSAKELMALFGKLKGEEADIEFSDSEIHIKNGRTKAGIRLDAEIHMPLDEIELPGDKEWKKLPPAFGKILKAVVFSTSKDMSQPIFTVIHCSKDRVESTDSDRATCWKLEKPFFPEDILLPAEAAKYLIGHTSLTHYAPKGGWIHFKVENSAVFSCRTFEGEYPSLTSIFEIEGKELVFPADTKEILDRAGIFVESDYDQDQLVHISINGKGVLKVRAEGQSGWIEESVRMKDSGKQEIAFSINPQHLQQILGTVNKGTVSSDRILFESSNFQHVVSLEVVE